MDRQFRAGLRVAAALSGLAAAGLAGPAHAVPGDTFDEAIVVGPPPVLVTGTTCGFGNDAADLCDTGPQGAPDVFYRFTAAHDGPVTVSTCASWFPNSFVLYDRFRRVLRCRPGGCLLGGYERFQLQADSTYYVGIEGEDGGCGRYVFSIDDCPDECAGAFARCGPDALAEGEPSCVPGYVDRFNDGSCTPEGCNVSRVPCTGTEVNICGTTGRFEGRNDWDVHEFIQEAPSRVTIAVASQRAALSAGLTRRFEGKEPEWVAGIRINYGILFDDVLPPGRYWLGFGPDSHSFVPCDNPTMIRITGLSCTSTPTAGRGSSWGLLKATYR